MITKLFDRALQKQSPVFDTAIVPSVLYLISFLTGYICYNFFNSVFLWIVFLVFIVTVSYSKYNKIKIINILLILILFTTGYFWGIYSVDKIISEYDGINEKSLSANFRVLSEIEYKDKYIKFDGEFLNTDYIGKKCQISVNGYAGNDININDIVYLKNFSMKSVPPYRIPEQILNESNRVSDNIFLFASSFDATIEKISDGKFSITSFFNDIKDSLRGILNRFLKKNQFDFISGILTGYKDYSNEYLSDILTTTGISHVVVVSGMHFSILIFVLLYILRSFMLGPKISALITIIFSFIIALFFGITPSVLRALIMTDILLIADIINKDKTSGFHYLILTAVIMILINPMIIYDIGFILSFSSVLGLFLFSNKIYNKIKFVPDRIKSIVSASVAANLITIPICAYYFNTLSLSFIMGNLIITPFVSILMIYSMICIIMAVISDVLGIIFFAPLNFVLGVLFMPLEFIAKIPFLNFKVISPSITSMLLYYTGLVLITGKHIFKLSNVLGYIMIVYFIISLFISESFFFNCTDIYALGNEQSGKIVINSNGKTIVCDLSNSDEIYDLETILNKKCLSKADIYIVASIPALEGMYNIRDKIEIDKIIYPDNFNDNILLTEKLSNCGSVIMSNSEYKIDNIENISLTIINDNNYNINSVLIRGKKDTLLITNTEDEELYKDSYNVFSYDKLNYFKYNKLLLSEEIINKDKKQLYQERIK